MPTDAAPNEPLLILENISKVYPGVIALGGVSMRVMRGEVLALVAGLQFRLLERRIHYR